MAKKTKASLMLPDGTTWDWDAVTTDLVAYIVEGGTRARFCAQKHTPSITKLFEFVGDHQDRNARVMNAYRFRSGGRLDELQDARAKMLDEQMTPQMFQQLQNGLMQEIRTMTNMATTPNKAEPIKAIVNDGDLTARIERASDIHEAKD